MENEILNGNFQTKQNTAKEIKEPNGWNEMERNLQTFHVRRKI
jgi:hypothetical protein